MLKDAGKLEAAKEASELYQQQFQVLNRKNLKKKYNFLQKKQLQEIRDR